MALFGLFGKKDEAEEIRKLQAKAMQKFGKENRQKALHQLREYDKPAAYTALLQRFTLNVEPGITDEEEKEFVFDALVDAGEAAVEPVRRFIERSEHPTWAIRVLERLVSEEEVIGTVLAALEREGNEYTRVADKKVTLIRHLESRSDPRIAPGLVPFLEDVNEDVAIAALAALGIQKDESTREPLIQTLLRAHEQAVARLRLAAAESLVQSGFSVKGFTPSVQAALPPGFMLDKDGVVKRK